MNWLSDSVNVIGLLGAVAILVITIYVVGFYVKKMKTAENDGELTEHDWDGIKEYKNDIPMGWLVIFILVIIWGFWYMFFGYPLKSFSQIGQYNEEVKASNEKFEQQWQNLTPQDKIAMGEGIFLVQCSQCHGLNAEGINGQAQNLRAWGKEEGIIHTIEMGSKGLNYIAGDMPPGLLTSDDEKRQVAAYVMKTFSPSKSTKYSQADVEAGKVVYQNVCATCHANDGSGNANGIEGFASNLNTYGDYVLVEQVLRNGKKGFIGKMPSFNYANFSERQVEALAAYISSLAVND